MYALEITKRLGKPNIWNEGVTVCMCSSNNEHYDQKIYRMKKTIKSFKL